MKIKNSWMLLAITMVCLCMVSCSRDDDDEIVVPNDEETNKNSEETDNNSTSESTEYIGTEQLKTITLKPNKQEYLIYKDYYWKHKLYLDGTRICFNSYYGGGNGWILSNGGSAHLGEGHVGIRDRGETESINSITGTTIVYVSWVTSTKHFCIRPNSSYVEYFGNTITFKPNHGYEVAFLIDTNDKIKHMRIFPTKYTLDKNDVLSSLTLEYQLF